MILEQTTEHTEFTEDSLLETLKSRFGTKKNGKDFVKNDIVQYIIRGKIPKEYGNNKLKIGKQFGIKLLYVAGIF